MYGEDPRYEYAFAFVASGCIGMLTLWLEQDTPCSAEEMAQMMEGLIAKAAEAMAPQSDPKTR